MITTPFRLLALLLFLPLLCSAATNPSERIDQLVRKELKGQKLKPNANIADHTFLRRAYLHIAGRIPTPNEADSFLDDPYKNKRERLIEELLHAPAHAHHLYNFWADILRINDGLGNNARQAEAAYELWLKEAIQENTPYDEFVRQLIAGKGNIWDNGAVGYYLRDRGMPLDNMSNTVRVFLGVRLECAQCHNHPFDKWTQMDYFKMAAFSYGMNTNYSVENRSIAARQFAEKRTELFREATGHPHIPVLYREIDVERLQKDQEREQKLIHRSKLSKEDFYASIERGQKAIAPLIEGYEDARQAESRIYQRLRYYHVDEKPRGLKLPHDYQYSDAKPHDVVSAETMFGADIDVENVDDSAIDSYAAWMTSRENPTFTRVIANRLWKYVFGQGIFEPVDELTDQTFISNPALLDYLETLMLDLDYDVRAYLQILYNTRTWQRAMHAEEVPMGTPFYFTGPILRRMSAEQIWDSVVGLAIPEADHYRPKVKDRLKTVEQIRQMYTSITERTPDEYMAMLDELGEMVAEFRPKEEAARADFVAARLAEDGEAYKEARLRLSQIQREANQSVNRIAFTHLGEEGDGSQLLAALGMSEMTLSSNAMGGSSMMGDAPQAMVVTKLPKVEMPSTPEGLSSSEKKRWLAVQKTDLRDYQKLVAGMARAAELDSPAPRGHFLREFGQSDREVIENSASHASIPQALNLLNGPIVEALINRFSVFGSRLHESGDPETKVRMIFHAMLTRQPSKSELSLALSQVEQYGDRAYEGIVWALLNTQQFLFVE
ncbi:MAG: DUF1549 domain-containing protein [Verrucomicrobiota bacterium]